MSAPDLTIVPIETPTLGDRSYLAHDGEVALVVDPQRDIDRVLALLEEHGVRLTHVFETHIHNDYVTGGLALAERTGAAYLVNGEDEVGFARTPIADGEVVEVGERMRVTALATPGHTFTHLSYALADAAADEGRGADVAVFSGGSLLFGATGRPDLLGEEHTHDLVRAQHASARRLADTLPDDAEVLPTHGFGSFCSATQSEATASTIGQEKQANPVLVQDEETYVRELLAGLSAYPAYYAHMAPANVAGPSEPDLSAPAQADPHELRRRIDAGEWVVDLRSRTVFAAGHVPGLAELRPRRRLRDLPRLARRVGHPADAARRDRRRRRDRAARAGPDRHRPAGRGRDRQAGGLGGRDRPRARDFPTATFADLAQVRHHRDGHGPRRAPGRRARRGPDRRRGQHPAARAARRGWPTYRPARSGCTAPAATAPPSPRRSWPPPGAPSSPSTTPSTTLAEVGLPTVGPDA